MIILTILSVIAAFTITVRQVLRSAYAPQRASWFGRMLVDLVLAYSSYKNGGPRNATFVLGASYHIGSTAVWLLSIKLGVGGTTPLDIACIVLAAGSGLLSYRYGLHGFGIAASAAGIWIAGAPNLLSALKKPQLESQ